DSRSRVWAVVHVRGRGPGARGSPGAASFPAGERPENGRNTAGGGGPLPAAGRAGGSARVQTHRQALVSVADQGRDGGQVGRRFRQADLREAVEEALQREGDLHAGEGGTEAEVHPVAEGHVVLDRAGRVEGVGVVVPVGMPVGGRVGGEY